MAAEVEFALLGPLEVRRSGVLVPLAAGRQRALLATLLLGAGQVVPTGELIEVLWEDQPPPTARAGLHNYVRRLRRALADDQHEQIITCPQGYQIKTRPGALDMTRFEGLLGAARAAAQRGSWQVAAGQARAALALWRGEPLADTRSQVLALRQAPRLVELRLQALEVAADAGLRLGQHAGLIGELRSLVAGYPLRERLYALLMLALYRDDRQAEALAVYQDARRMLAEELGTEPGPGLRELHQQILTTDPALASAWSGQPAAVGMSAATWTLPRDTGSLSGRDGELAPPAQAAAAGGGRVGIHEVDGMAGAGKITVPRQLPGAARHFAGRGAELAALNGLLSRSAQEAPLSLVISAIAGTAGVGKTALALHWAHQVADRFPDGQLYVNLRGYDPGRPTPAAGALAGFLRALGVSGQDIPRDAGERAARYRSLLAGRRLLVVLDNAGSVEQVRPLLPGTPGCVAVVTSRDALTGLVARDGAVRLDLDLLPLADAVGLLRALIGQRFDASPGAAEQLARRCARLPLALRVAAELAAARPTISLADLAGELADQRRRLDLLDADGDPRTAVRAVFSWSLDHLDARAARAFRLLGLHPGPDLDRYAMAALTGTTLAQAGRLLNQLSHAHLTQRTTPGRYGLHDLLRAYARELAAVRDRQEDRRAALTRLFDHYLSAAAAAMNTLSPGERHTRPRCPPPATPAPPLTQPAAARAWLDAERATLIAVAEYAAGHGWTGHTTRLATTLFRYLDGGDYREAITLYTLARRAAQRVGDRCAEASALTSIGAVEWQQGRYQQASSHLRSAMDLHRETGDQAGEARALTNLGNVECLRGRHQQAADLHEQALARYRDTGEQAGEVRTLGNLGAVYERQGRYEQADGLYQRALLLCRETGDRAGQAYALTNLGDLDQRRGRCPQAGRHLRQALALFRQTGDRSGEAYALNSLGHLDLRQGRSQQAADHCSQALALFRQIGDRSGEARALNGLGEVLLAAGQAADAHAQHTAALGLARPIGDKREQARAHDGLARSGLAAGDHGQARRHWRKALALYTGLGDPAADQIRALWEAGTASTPCELRFPGPGQ